MTCTPSDLCHGEGDGDVLKLGTRRTRTETILISLQERVNLAKAHPLIETVYIHKILAKKIMKTNTVKFPFMVHVACGSLSYTTSNIYLGIFLFISSDFKGETSLKLQPTLSHTHILGQRSPWKITGLYHFRPGEGGGCRWQNALVPILIVWYPKFLFFLLFRFLFIKCNTDSFFQDIKISF